MEFFTIETRDEKKIKYPVQDILGMEDFFLRNMLEDCEDSKEAIYINEDYDIIINILDSLRYKKLIYKEDTNFSLMKAVAEKWCVPEWLIKAIGYDPKEETIDNLKSLFERAIKINEDITDDIENVFYLEIVTTDEILDKKSNFIKKKEYGIYSLTYSNLGPVYIIPSGNPDEESYYINYKNFTAGWAANERRRLSLLIDEKKEIKNIEHLLDIINFFKNEDIVARPVFYSIKKYNWGN